MMIKRLIFLSGIALAVPAVAGAAETDRTSLFSEGAWVVEHVYARSNGLAWCEATTTNGSGQTFDISAFNNGNATLYVFDDAWALEPRAVRFRIDIDYNQWSVDGEASDGVVSVGLNGAAEAGDFLDELAAGGAVAMYNENGRQLAAFSLNGSRAALWKLAECWAQILPSDPFGSGPDPFRAASDPF